MRARIDHGLFAVCGILLVIGSTATWADEIPYARIKAVGSVSNKAE